MKAQKYDVLIAKTTATIQRLSTILERYIYEGVHKHIITREINGSIIDLIEINTALDMMENKDV